MTLDVGTAIGLAGFFGGSLTAVWTWHEGRTRRAIGEERALEHLKRNTLQIAEAQQLFEKEVLACLSATDDVAEQRYRDLLERIEKVRSANSRQHDRQQMQLSAILVKLQMKDTTIGLGNDTN